MDFQEAGIKMSQGQVCVCVCVELLECAGRTPGMIFRGTEVRPVDRNPDL